MLNKAFSLQARHVDFRLKCWQIPPPWHCLQKYFRFPCSHLVCRSIFRLIDTTLMLFSPFTWQNSAALHCLQQCFRFPCSHLVCRSIFRSVDTIFWFSSPFNWQISVLFTSIVNSNYFNIASDTLFFSDYKFVSYNKIWERFWKRTWILDHF